MFTKLSVKGMIIPRPLLLLLIFFLSGCASYTPKPLSMTPQLTGSLNELIKVANKAYSNIQVPLDQPLTLQDMSLLALVGNPDLKAKREAVKVAEAQLYSAGLFADPQLSANLDHPTSSLPGLTNAWGLGLGYDISSLIGHSMAKDAARSKVAQAKLGLMWDGWQVILKARTLSVQSQLEQKRIALLSSVYERALSRYKLSTKHMADGNVTLEVNSSDLTSLLDVSSQLNLLRRTHNDTLSQLDYLLGLAPGVQITQALLPKLHPMSKAEILKKLKLISKTRPDLLALKAGYESQEARVRAAILGQFPAFNLGFSKASDTSNLHTTGINIGLTLPLFSGNKGAIAVERATREQLNREYQARLSQARRDIYTLMNLQTIVQDQQQQLETYLPTLDRLVNQAQKAYQNRDLAALTFLNIDSTWIKSQLEKVDLMQTQWQTQIALQALLGDMNNHDYVGSLIQNGARKK
jgi:outer membrane protein TolC